MLKLLFVNLIIFLFMGTSAAQAASLKQAFSEGKFKGQLRIYNNTLALQHAPDKYGTAFGGRLGYETNQEHLWGFSLGLGYYTANDLETNKDEAISRAPFTPTVDVDILGEAFARWSGYDTVLTAGRQLVVTPFANPSDAFVIPVTYTGYSAINKSIEGLTLSGYQLLSIKSREAQDFVDVGEFALARYGVAPQQTEGTLIFGASYEINRLKIQAWHYTFSDLYTQPWLEADYALEGETYKPYFSTHAGQQKKTQGALLGDQDSTLLGAKVGVKAFGADLSIATETVTKDRFLSPYTFFTDALYTNSMITGFGNIDSGRAWKAMLLYDITSQLWAKLSYSTFKFNSGTDISEMDFDVRYTFTEDFEGLSALFRLGYRDGDTTPAALPDMIEYRTQLQYLF